jgi:predicted metal-dependent hydrolase
MKRLVSHEQMLLELEAPAAQPADPPRERDNAAARQIRVGTDVFAYRLRRARRRSIGFQIDDLGLTVSAPRWVPLREVEAAIAEKRRWIVTKQREWKEWRSKRRLPPVRFVDGASVPYLGSPLQLRLAAGSASTRQIDATLHLALPADASEVRVRDTVQAWLQVQARRVLAERIERFDGRISERYAGWTLSSARSQWGSCTHDGRIRLSWRLIHFALPVIDYVVAHELAHLRELNHSARFWDAVAHLLPGFEPAREAIRRVDIESLPL